MRYFVLGVCIAAFFVMGFMVYRTNEMNVKLREDNAMLREKLIVQDVAHEKVINSMIRRRK